MEKRTCRPVSLHCGDCLDVMQTFPDHCIDAIVTDPPYGLRFMGKKWDYDVPGIDVWKECLRILKPGGHLISFGGSRTYHRLAINIEDAGFELRDQIMWVYGSGFPKSMDASKAIDKHLAGTQRAAPASPEAQRWQGWGTALKPAHEPIAIARKPLDGTVAHNVLTHGVGAINIDGARIPVDRESTLRPPSKVDKFRLNTYRRFKSVTTSGGHPDGRWPANLIHDGSPEVLDVFALAGDCGASAPVRGTELSDPAKNTYGKFGRVAGTFHADKGSPARFFYCAKASPKDRNDGCEVLEKQQGRNRHPTVKPTDLMRYLCRLVTPAGGVILDPFMGSGSTGKAAKLEGFRFIGIEREADFLSIANARIEAAE